MSTIIPERFKDKTIIHKTHAFGTGAATTTLLAAPGTGLAIVPVYMYWHASAVGSFTLQKGLSGSVMLHGNFQTAHIPDQLPWWDDGASETVGANTAIAIVKADGCGAGEFHLWYVICRLGAGGGGTTQ